RTAGDHDAPDDRGTIPEGVGGAGPADLRAAAAGMPAGRGLAEVRRRRDETAMNWASNQMTRELIPARPCCRQVPDQSFFGGASLKNLEWSWLRKSSDSQRFPSWTRMSSLKDFCSSLRVSITAGRTPSVRGNSAARATAKLRFFLSTTAYHFSPCFAESFFS